MTDERIVKSSSFTRAQDFIKCPLFFKLRHIDKVPDPAPPLPEGQERPMDRGIRIHKLAENYIKNPMMKLPKELATHEDGMKALQSGHAKGKVDPEIAIGFDSNWSVSGVTDFDNTIYRMVIDVAVTVSDARIFCIDFKTGKKKGNEVKHHEQLMEYAIGVSLLDPEVQIFDTAIWYLDLPPGENIMKKMFTRTQVIKAFPTMRKRHENVLNATVFPAKPSQFACRFCPYKAGEVGRGKNAYPGTGHCRRNIC